MADVAPAPATAAVHVFAWDEIMVLTRLLADRVRHTPIDCIAGIARSGLIPAVILSHMLNVRNFAVLDIARTLSDDIGALKRDPVRAPVDLAALCGKKVLVVDDIVGQGLTVDMARDMMLGVGADATFATLVVNQDNLSGRNPRDVVDHWACTVHGWVVFPWEDKDMGSA